MKNYRKFSLDAQMFLLGSESRSKLALPKEKVWPRGKRCQEPFLLSPKAARDQGAGDLRLRIAQGWGPEFAPLLGELKGHVAKKIGPIARSDEILFAAELPNTRIAEVSDLPNLLNASSLPAVRINARPGI